MEGSKWSATTTNIAKSQREAEATLGKPRPER
jgi:hypothetical protein